MRRFVLTFVAALSLVFLPRPSSAQEVFHSTQAANLKTAETIRPGNLLFEISHRFFPPVSSGGTALWGLDGPVFNRLGLSYQATDRLLVGALRTNLEDNLELNAKLLLVEADVAGTAMRVAALGGIAWNTDLREIDEPGLNQLQTDNERQLYAQLLANFAVGEKAAVGVVPTYLRNPNVIDVESGNAFALGLHGQVWVGGPLSFLGEWIFSEERPGFEHDSGTFGIELETRGHFFKIVLTNQTRMNPTQFLAGAPVAFDPDDLSLGFNITRLLPF